MWTRKELKDKAKVSFKANYWKSVFVALVLMAVIGGMSFYSSGQSASSALTAPAATATSSYSADNVNVDIRDGKVKVDVDDGNGGKVHVNMDADDLDDLRDTLQEMSVNNADSGYVSAFAGPGAVLFGLSMFLIVLIVAAVAIAIYVFVLSPLEVGAQRFFVRNLNQRSEVKELAFGYDNNYKETVKTLFLRDLFIMLWALLLIIPGIYKSYEYRMIPYLLAEDPAMTKDRAFSESKRMMYGHKWNTFVLDLSFLGWNILSALTLGILGVFYVGPYQAQTNAALYEKLRYGLPAPEQPMQAAPYAGTPASPVPPASYVNAQGQAMPVIVSESQPPVPPFAQVGAQPESEFESTIPMGFDAEADVTTPLPESDLGTTAPLSDAEADVTTPLPENASATTAPVSDAQADVTTPLPQNDSGTTVPMPEAGIDPTTPMPGIGENAEAPDSTEA